MVSLLVCFLFSSFATLIITDDAGPEDVSTAIQPENELEPEPEVLVEAPPNDNGERGSR